MDPRHPELAIARMDELMSQFKSGLSKIRTETITNKIGAEERELSLVVQELCLVAPRLHEAMMQVSRTRRAAISRGLVTEYTPEEPKNTVSHDGYLSVDEAIEEIPTPPNQAEVEIVEPKPRKKKTTKKKKAE